MSSAAVPRPAAGLSAAAPSAAPEVPRWALCSRPLESAPLTPASLSPRGFCCLAHHDAWFVRQNRAVKDCVEAEGGRLRMQVLPCDFTITLGVEPMTGRNFRVETHFQGPIANMDSRLKATHDRIWAGKKCPAIPQVPRDSALRQRDNACLVNYHAARQRVRPLAELVEECAAETGGRGVEVSVKRLFRALLNVRRKNDPNGDDFGCVFDLLRASIVYETPEALARGFDYLRAKSEIVCCRNRLDDPAQQGASAPPLRGGGYRCVLLKVKLEKLVCEIQLHIYDLYRAKGEVGRRLYKWVDSARYARESFEGEHDRSGLETGPKCRKRWKTEEVYAGAMKAGAVDGKGTMWYVAASASSSSASPTAATAVLLPPLPPYYYH